MPAKVQYNSESSNGGNTAVALSTPYAGNVAIINNLPIILVELISVLVSVLLLSHRKRRER